MPTKFYSRQIETHKLTHEPLGSGNTYRFFNFAVLRSNGLDMVFDMMRYDNAFLGRKADVDHICDTLENGDVRFAIQPFSILLVRFDWRGKTKPNWTPQRLLSTQSYEFITDPMTLYDIHSDVTEWHIKPPAKFKSIIEFTGTPCEIIRLMHANRAFPASEGDANQIERGLYSLDEKLTIQPRLEFSP